MRRRALIIDGYNTATDGLMTLTAFSVETPKYRVVTQSVPSMDGALDYADALNGRPCYDTRKLTASLESSAGSFADRQQRFDAFVQHCNGRRCRIVSPDHPNSYYVGRVQASIAFNNLAYGQIKIEAVCEPWRYSAVPCVASVPVLGLSADALTTAEISYMDDASTCEVATYSVSATAIAGNFSILSGEVRSTAIWRITLAANTDYYVVARVRDGRGTWGCATDISAKSWTRGAVRTGADGYLYIRLETFKTTSLIITPVMVIPASKIYTVQNGIAPAIASVNFAAASAEIKAKSIAAGTGEELTVLSNKDAWDIDMPPGDIPLLLYTWQTETEGQTIPIIWTRGDF